MLNEGKVQKNFFGGLQPVMMAMAAQASIQGAATNPGFAPMLKGISSVFGKKKDDNDYFKYGGRVQKFAGGGEAQFFGANTYRYNDALYPTAGEDVIDQRLSLQAITDENNPQNAKRKEREAALYDYLNYVQDVMQSNRDALEENIRMNQQIQDEYNNQKSAKSRGAFMGFGLGLLGAAGSQFSSMGGFDLLFAPGSPLGSKEVRRARPVNDVNLRSGYGSTDYTPTQPAPYSGGRLKVGKASGGYIKGFANGGSSGKDDIPALLMGGEFVMRKEAVNNYGKKFFDDLNSGRARKFANGGTVGNSMNQVGEVGTAVSTNNVNITVNVSGGEVASDNMNQNSTSSAQEDNQKRGEDSKALATLIKNQVMEVISQQQRPGGILRR